MTRHFLLGPQPYQFNGNLDPVAKAVQFRRNPSSMRRYGLKSFRCPCFGEHAFWISSTYNMLSQGAVRRALFLLFVPFLLFSSLLIFHSVSTGKVSIPNIHDLNSLTRNPVAAKPTELPEVLRRPPYVPPPPITDNFPLAAKSSSPADLPPIPSWNAPPDPHIPESTPLFIGFTRNWRLIQQVVVSYITAGWPASDIYVIENTGVMNSNREGKLTLQNPFFLDHHRLTKVLGINVIQTPTLFTFAQLQNFYVYTALERNWTHYFWAHMDTVMVSDEEWPEEPWKPVYTRAVDALRETLDPAWGPLATRWFAYDTLALVRTQAFVDVGGWDTMIPFYMTDCDMHERLWMKDFRIENAAAGKIWDVASAMDDLEVLYHRGGDSVQSAHRNKRDVQLDVTNATSPSSSPPPLDPSTSVHRSSVLYHALLRTLDTMQHEKHGNKAGRNTWQARQGGGQGEPFYRDPEGFEKAVEMTMDFGHKVFEEKWGRGECNLRDVGMGEADAWRVEREWEKVSPLKWLLQGVEMWRSVLTLRICIA